MVQELFEYLWIVFFIGSFFYVDLYFIFLFLGVMEIKICYFGGFFVSVINYMMWLNVLMVLLYSVVFVYCKDCILMVLLFKILYLDWVLGIFWLVEVLYFLVVDKYVVYIVIGFCDFWYLIKWYEDVVVWGGQKFCYIY